LEPNIKIYKFKCSPNYYFECINNGVFNKNECNEFKCITNISSKIFKKGKGFEVYLHVKSQNRREPTSLIKTQINGILMSDFTIRTDFQIWTINRITVELKNFLVLQGRDHPENPDL